MISNRCIFESPMPRSVYSCLSGCAMLVNAFNALFTTGTLANCLPDLGWCVAEVS